MEPQSKQYNLEDLSVWADEMMPNVYSTDPNDVPSSEELSFYSYCEKEREDDRKKSEAFMAFKAYYLQKKGIIIQITNPAHKVYLDEFDAEFKKGEQHFWSKFGEYRINSRQEKEKPGDLQETASQIGSSSWDLDDYHL